MPEIPETSPQRREEIRRLMNLIISVRPLAPGERVLMQWMGLAIRAPESDLGPDRFLAGAEMPEMPDISGFPQTVPVLLVKQGNEWKVDTRGGVEFREFVIPSLAPAARAEEDD